MSVHSTTLPHTAMATEKQESNNKDPSATAKPAPTDNIVVTKHKARINGETIAYTVTCGTVVLKEDTEKDGNREAEKPRASIFFMAYTRDGVKDAARRPLTFSFNGGPGSSSVWLHLGVLGPKRVKLDNEGNAGPPPYALVDNEFSLLNETDLVFIDQRIRGWPGVALIVEFDALRPEHPQMQPHTR